MSKIIKLKTGGFLVYNKHKEKDLTSFAFGIKRGYASDKSTGITYLFEKMLFGGTKTLSAQEIERQFRFDYQSTGTACSENEFMIIGDESSKTIAEQFALLSDMIFNNSFDEKQLESAKKFILQESQLDQENATYQSFISIIDQMYNHTEQKSKKLGDAEKVSKVTARQLSQFVKDNFTKQNFIACVSTDLSKKEIVALMNEHFFDKMADGEKEFINTEKLEINKFSSMNVIEKPSKLIQMSVAFPTQGYADFKYVYYYNHLMKILSGRYGLVFKSFRQDKQIANHCTAMGEIREKTGMWGVALHTTPKELNSCIYAVKGLLNDLKAGVSEQDFNDYLADYDLPTSLEFVGNSNSCVETFINYVKTGKLNLEKEVNDLNKKFNLTEFNNFLKELVEHKDVYVCLVGNVNKKEVLPITKIRELLIEREAKQ